MDVGPFSYGVARDLLTGLRVAPRPVDNSAGPGRGRGRARRPGHDHPLTHSSPRSRTRCNGRVTVRRRASPRWVTSAQGSPGTPQSGRTACKEQAVVGDGEGTVGTDDPVDLQQLGPMAYDIEVGDLPATARRCSTTAPTSRKRVCGHASSARSTRRPAARATAARRPTQATHHRRRPQGGVELGVVVPPTCWVQNAPPGRSTRAISAGSRAPCRFRTRSKSEPSHGSRRSVRALTSTRSAAGGPGRRGGSAGTVQCDAADRHTERWRAPHRRRCRCPGRGRARPAASAASAAVVPRQRVTHHPPGQAAEVPAGQRLGGGLGQQPVDLGTR